MSNVSSAARSGCSRQVAVATNNLTFTYRGSQSAALRGVTLSIMEGELVGLMGHAGCGKSTLCMCLAGLIPHFLKGALDGEITLQGCGFITKTIREIGKSVGLVFQDFESQLVSTNVEQELAFGPENHGLPRNEMARRVDKYLDLTQLGELRYRQQVSLSGGQRQLLAIAAVLTMETPVVVLDDPMSDLDPSNADKVRGIARSTAEGNRTVIVVEHEPESVVGADRLVLMSNGQIAAEGRTAQLLANLELMERCGVRPPQLAVFFRNIGVPELPLNVEDAVALLPTFRRSTYWHFGETAKARHTNPPILETRNVFHVYSSGGISALENVTFQVYDNEFIAIVGKNGSGKSTLGKLLSGLLRPSTGVVCALGGHTSKMSRRSLALFVGYVFQNPAYQIFAPTVYEEVAFGPRNFGMAEDEILARVTQALSAVDLEGYQDRDPFALTKGERQRVAVASILVARPRILILDEPTTGLDYPQQRSMMEMLVRLHQEGHVVIIITHSMWVAAEYAARTVVMRNGSVILDGPTREVFRREEELASANLKPPPIVQLSNRLNIGALSVEEMTRAFVSGFEPTR